MKVAVKSLERGLRLQQAGRVAEAESLYGEVLERNPANADAWHLLGRIALDRGDLPSAAARVLQAVRHRPDIPGFYNTLGEVLAAQGRIRDATLCYQQALQLEPAFTAALVNLGNALQAEGRYGQAAVAYWKAIQAQPDCPEAFSNLGNALRADGRHEEALDCCLEAVRLRPGSAAFAVNLAAGLMQLRRFAEAEQQARRALALHPGLVEALSNLSMALKGQQRYEEAEAACRAALERAPQAAHLHSNLASVLLDQKRLGDAEAACRRSLELRPGHPEAANSLGAVLRAQGRFEDAAEQFAFALAAQPDRAETWTNLGTVRQAQNRHDEALACFAEALTRQPQHAKSRFCRSMSLLTQGDFARGFAEYEWRWEAAGCRPRVPSKAVWDGAALDGRTILLYAEQGLGDTIQFIRYAPEVAARGGRVIVEAQAAVAAIVAGVAGVAAVVTPESEPPSFDVEAALLSLPHILGRTPGAAPAETPYLKADRARIGHWRQALGSGRRLRVGLAWLGNPLNESDRARSTDLTALQALGGVPGVEWHSLHVGAKARGQVEQAGGWIRDWGEETADLRDLAGLMGCLDLIVSVDTMPAHLAGALGRPVWTMLPFAADWRWLLAREDSPWYPSMRLFRQTAPGDWDSVVGPLAEKISWLAAQEFRQRDDEHN